MDVSVVDAFGIADAHGLQDLDDSPPALAPVDAAMDGKRFQDLVACLHHRIERELRILQDHGDLLAPHLAHLGFRHALQILAHEIHALGLEFAGIGNEPQDGAPQGRLARTGFADDAQLLAAQFETDAPQRVDHAHRRDVAHGEIVDAQQRLDGIVHETAFRSSWGRARRAVRRPAG